MAGLETEKRIALQAVQRACRLAQTVFHQGLALSSIAVKDDCSPVTVADFGVQALINALLREVFPQDRVLAEESSELLSSNQHLLEKVWSLVSQTLEAEDKGVGYIQGRQDLVQAIEHAGRDGTESLDGDTCGRSVRGSSRCWVIDPIDGTKGFVRGGQYAVCLALLQNGQPSLGVLGCPNLHKNENDNRLGVVFYACKGEGAYQATLNGSDECLIHVNRIENVVDARVCQSLAPGHSALETHRRIIGLLGITKPPMELDSQVKYALLARGESDIYLRLPVDPNYHEKVWEQDHAAGALIVEEAGGIVTDAYGEALDFSKGKRLSENHGIVAASKYLHAKVLEAVTFILKK